MTAHEHLASHLPATSRPDDPYVYLRLKARRPGKQKKVVYRFHSFGRLCPDPDLAIHQRMPLRGCRLYIYWGYTSAGLIYSPPEGVPVTNLMTNDNKWAKNRQLNGYYNWFNSYYPEDQESLLTARRNSHGVISCISLPTE